MEAITDRSKSKESGGLVDLIDMMHHLDYMLGACHSRGYFSAYRSIYICNYLLKNPFLCYRKRKENRENR